MSKDFFSGEQSQGKAPEPGGINDIPDEEDDDFVEDPFREWPTMIVTAVIVIILAGLFVFIGSLPAIHEHQKNEAIRNGTLRP